MQKLSLACLAAGVLLAGCSTYGDKVLPEDLARFQPGVTLCVDIVRALEPKKPTTSTQHSNGTRQITYVYGHSELDAGAIALAVIGIPAGRSAHEQTSVVIECDTAGLLTTHSSTTGQVGVGMGVTGGAKQ